MTTWFTADQHFYHTNIIKYTSRPFDSVEEMNEVMIERWNKVVKNGDTVYQLGDFALCSTEKADEIRKKLNGNILFIPGGHDKWIKTDHKDKGIILESLVILKYIQGNDKIYITLCHYPMLSWERSHYGMPHFHGHTHGTIGLTNKSADILLPPHMKQGIRIDVGVDCWGFYPMDLQTLLGIALK
jgi:calcineurin-like phosphoesterase family protein